MVLYSILQFPIQFQDNCLCTCTCHGAVHVHAMALYMYMPWRCTCTCHGAVQYEMCVVHSLRICSVRGDSSDTGLKLLVFLIIILFWMQLHLVPINVFKMFRSLTYVRTSPSLHEKVRIVNGYPCFN